jgi:hypothetical protein
MVSFSSHSGQGSLPLYLDPNEDGAYITTGHIASNVISGSVTAFSLVAEQVLSPALSSTLRTPTISNAILLSDEIYGDDPHVLLALQLRDSVAYSVWTESTDVIISMTLQSSPELTVTSTSVCEGSDGVCIVDTDIPGVFFERAGSEGEVVTIQFSTSGQTKTILAGMIRVFATLQDLVLPQDGGLYISVPSRPVFRRRV